VRERVNESERVIERGNQLGCQLPGKPTRPFNAIYQCAFMNESWHMYGCVMARVWMSHVICMYESCRTYNLAGGKKNLLAHFLARELIIPSHVGGHKMGVGQMVQYPNLNQKKTCACVCGQCVYVYVHVI